MFTLDIPFNEVATTFQAQLEIIGRRLAELDDDESERPNDRTLGAAARLLSSLQRANIAHNFAFGADGSIGVHITRDDRTEYVDFLNDGRIRYYWTLTSGVRFGQVIPVENADNFLYAYCTATMQLSFDISRTEWVLAFATSSHQHVA